MARRPRSRASRAERRMLKERAASAIKHGLPVPTALPLRARIPEVASSRSPSGAGLASAGVSEPSNRRMPLAVKLLGLGLLLLGVVYGLTLFRDHHSEADALRPASESQAQQPRTSSASRSAAIAPMAEPSKPSLTSGLPADLGAMMPMPAAALSSASPRPRDSH